MTEETFRAKRRQKFLTEKYFLANSLWLQRSMALDLQGIENMRAEGGHDADGQGAIFKDKLKLVRLHYTAGEPIESLRPLYADAMHWFGEWHRAEDEYSQYLAKKSGKDLRLDMTPVEFADLFHFQLAVEVVSLGLLLGEGDAVRRAAALMQSERHTDMLLETLLEPAVADPDTAVDVFLHNQPYDPLLDAVYTAETPEEASAFVKKYLDGWYQAFEGVPWHNGHLVMTPEYSNYEGYWSFEAAAVCLIHGIDDATFRDHLVYPKDLADWAREHHVIDVIRPSAGVKAMQVRCEAGRPCPQSGWWSTPAKTNSRKNFKAGETMPEIEDSPWGSTIWYWDEQQ